MTDDWQEGELKASKSGRTLFLEASPAKGAPTISAYNHPSQLEVAWTVAVLDLHVQPSVSELIKTFINCQP